jgi:magnesium transporter
MNFSPDASFWNMPELRWRLGYPFALGLMAVISAGMLYFFWRKGWLGSTQKMRVEQQVVRHGRA